MLRRSISWTLCREAAMSMRAIASPPVTPAVRRMILLRASCVSPAMFVYAPGFNEAPEHGSAPSGELACSDDLEHEASKLAKLVATTRRKLRFILIFRNRSWLVTNLHMGYECCHCQASDASMIISCRPGSHYIRWHLIQ